jgi:hypothetical protein
MPKKKVVDSQAQIKAWHVPFHERTDEQIAEWQAELQRHIDAVSQSHPRIPFINAYVRAQDNMSADYATYRVEQGDKPEDAMVYCGSYSRMQWAKEHIPPKRLHEMLPGIWSGADPDDGDPAMLTMWQDAYRATGNRTLTDGAVPWGTSGKLLTIFRGQPTAEDMGISWSLDPKVAEKFRKGAAYRVGSMDGVMLIGQVTPYTILGYMGGRNESEVVVSLDKVMDIYVARPYGERSIDV